MTTAGTSPRVHTRGMIAGVPNQPRTPIRGIRIPDDVWTRAQEIAARRGESVSSVVRAALERYVKRHGGTDGR